MSDDNLFTILFVAWVIFLLIAILMFWCLAFQKLDELSIEFYHPGTDNIIQNNSFIASGPVYYPVVITHGTLIDCLIKRESSGNPRAYNEFDPKTESIGILQFKRATYQHFCVDRYGLPDDIWSEENQRSCCELMIRDNLEHHWTTLKFCEK